MVNINISLNTEWTVFVLSACYLIILIQHFQMKTVSKQEIITSLLKHCNRFFSLASGSLAASTHLVMLWGYAHTLLSVHLIQKTFPLTELQHLIDFSGTFMPPSGIVLTEREINRHSPERWDTNPGAIFVRLYSCPVMVFFPPSGKLWQHPQHIVVMSWGDCRTAAAKCLGKTCTSKGT